MCPAQADRGARRRGRADPDIRVAVTARPGSHVRLGPGSYLMQPGGSYRHTTACDKASECLFFIQSDGKFDLIPVDAAKK